MEAGRGIETLDDGEAEEEGTKKGEARDKRHDAADDSDDDAGVEDVIGVDTDGYDGRGSVLRARFWESDSVRALMPVEREIIPHAQASRRVARPAWEVVPDIVRELVARVVCLRRRGLALGWRGLCRQAMTHQQSVGTRGGIYSGSTLWMSARV